jgi:chorismate mutase
MDAYLVKIEDAARALVARRLLLADDVAFVKAAAGTHWQALTGTAPQSR